MFVVGSFSILRRQVDDLVLLQESADDETTTKMTRLLSLDMNRMYTETQNPHRACQVKFLFFDRKNLVVTTNYNNGPNCEQGATTTETDDDDDTLCESLQHLICILECRLSDAATYLE